MLEKAEYCSRFVATEAAYELLPPFMGTISRPVPGFFVPFRLDKNGSVPAEISPLLILQCILVVHGDDDDIFLVMKFLYNPVVFEYR